MLSTRLAATLCVSSSLIISKETSISTPNKVSGSLNHESRVELGILAQYFHASNQGFVAFLASSPNALRERDKARHLAIWLPSKFIDFGLGLQNLMDDDQQLGVCLLAIEGGYYWPLILARIG